MSIMKRLANLRRSVWHFRRGGRQQVLNYLDRSRVERDESGLGHLRGAEAGWRGWGRRRHLVFRQVDVGRVAPRNPNIRVGIIMDDFSAAAFSCEWSVVPLESQTWRRQLETEDLDFVVVESAWAGSSGLWRSKITSSHGPSEELVELTRAARTAGLVSVFWNKEDPPHYKDFLPAARLFDHVFTTDVNMLENYYRDLGHRRISVLPFAAQPAIHNPVRPQQGWHARNVAFAGMYFANKYPERREQMDYLLPAAIEATVGQKPGLEIFSRQLGGDPQYQFPAPYDKAVVGSLNYRQMLQAYKGYKIFLNVNSVVDSESMCARRIFEITAAGATVVSSPSKAIDSYFPGGEIPVVSSQESAKNVIKSLLVNSDYAERQVHKAQRIIWENHTFAHRALEIVSRAAPNLGSPQRVKQVSVLVSSFRPQQIDHVISLVSSQRNVDIQLVFLAHGFSLDASHFREKCAAAGLSRVLTLQEPRTSTLGDCLNLLVQHADSEYCTKWDDDDFYGPLYLSDQVNAIMFSSAEIVGKRAHYMHLESANATILRNPQLEHRFVDSVAGPTIFGKRTVFQSIPFASVTLGEDTRFLRDVRAGGGRIYSSDRFNYCQARMSNTAGHTWQITDEQLLASSKIEFFGAPEEHVLL